MEWKTFKFEGNQAWGVVDSPEEWLRILKCYKWNIDFLLGAKSKLTAIGDTPAFGLYGEYRFVPTLEEWAEAEGVNLRIVLNIHSNSADWKARILSNFHPGKFMLDGVQLNSVEGFIQGIKFPEESILRKYTFAASMSEAKEFGKIALALAGVLTHVWWQGSAIPFGTDEHRALIERAIRAKFEQDAEASKALRETGDLVLIHEVGGPDSVSLPKEVFCDILTRIRSELK